jgi:hypothetical protein
MHLPAPNQSIAHTRASDVAVAASGRMRLFFGVVITRLCAASRARRESAVQRAIRHGLAAID